jgi:hypothetical protein
MAKREVELSEEQKRKNELILAQIAAERARLIEDTRNLQRQFRRMIREQRMDAAGVHGDGLGSD